MAVSAAARCSDSRSPGVSLEAAIDELTNAIASFGEELVIVLDDLHTVTDPECYEFLDYFIEQLPEAARLVRDHAARSGAEARASPQPASSGRASRGRARVHEQPRHEASSSTTRASPSTRKQVETLCSHTEGWPAALVLAAIWLRSVSDPARAIREFGGNQRVVADYLTEEVLQSLDLDARGFLLRASVLGRFTAELCDAVLDRSDSAAVLAELERANLFVSRLEQGSWYRIHSLFAEFAVLELAAIDPAAELEIHRRAAVWLHARGRPVEAAEHAAQAGEYELVARLLADYHLVLIRTGGARTLLQWVREIPDAQLLEYPVLAVAAATATTMLGQSTLERRRLLGIADRAKERFPDRFGVYVEAVADMVRAAAIDGDVDRAVLAGRRAVELAEASGDDALVAALGGYAHALYFAGELEDAWTAALRAVEHPEAERRPPGHAFARSTLALVAAEQGRLASARTHAEKARSILGDVGSRRSWLGAHASAALGLVLAGEGQLAEAERELASAEHLFRDEVATVQHTWVLLQLARIRCRRGRLDEAEIAIRGAHEGMDELRRVRVRLGARRRGRARAGRRKAPCRPGRAARTSERGGACGAPVARRRSVGDGDRGESLPLAEHRAHAYAGSVPEARRQHARRCRGTGREARPRGPSAITHVIFHSRAVRDPLHTQCSVACPVGSTDSRSRAS